MDRFWVDPASEPKRAFRWLLFFAGVPQWIVKKVKKPSFEVTGAEHEFLNHTFKFPGRLKWGDVTMTLVDPVQPDAAGTMMRIIADSGYALPLAENVTQTISKRRAVAALGGQVRMQQLLADGADAGPPTEEWTLVNPWVSNVDFGELDYSSDELTNIEITVKYDFARIGLPSLARAVQG